MKQVRLGMIGLGNMGSSHARKLIDGACPEIRLTAVADIKPERLEWAKKELGAELPVFSSATAMMDSGLVDAICVAVPHYDHPTLAIEAMQKGL
ncbi:MAG: gfo/Idh/MocA family oxidoreductase, partial [Ruminococcaceae bacterium]|nr:gfo/Idh/MocA family oxidoreductase [Oscillospiraceae bacterium]